MEYRMNWCGYLLVNASRHFRGRSAKPFKAPIPRSRAVSQSPPSRRPRATLYPETESNSLPCLLFYLLDHTGEERSPTPRIASNG